MTELKTDLKNRFLVIAPDRESCVEYTPLISQYIYQTIISKPCEDLLLQIQEILKQRVIYGILTRGSLAKFLYENTVGVPIYQLEFSISNAFGILSDNRYKKLGIIEVAYDSYGDKKETKSVHFKNQDAYFSYHKVFDRTQIPSLIKELKDSGTECIIGDAEPRIEAARLGVPTVPIPIDAFDYENTINRAVLSTTSSLIEQSKSAFIEDITNIVSEAIFLFDDSGKVLKYNGTAEEIFLPKSVPADLSDLIGMTVDAAVSLPANSIVTLDEKSSLANIIPLKNEEHECYALIINNIKQIEDIEMSIRLSSKNKGLFAKTTFDTMLYTDKNMQNLVAKAKKYAKSNATIMICGPTGSGKEAFASSIHNESMRKDGPFVAINCATFSETLIESELFGYEKGAFTGALSTGKKGLFELAHRGTLFLDEVAELPLSIQSKLLRVIEEREVRRIGGEENIPVDVRILAASNKALCQQVELGEFREDLYYRLNVLDLIIPPLCERKADIIPLFKKFIYEASAREGKSVYWENDAVFDTILTYDWPGNVRELRNFAERIVLVADSYKLQKEYVDSMVAPLFESGPWRNKSGTAPEDTQRISLPLCNNLKMLETSYIKSLLDHFDGDKNRLCEYLGISKTTLWRKLSGE